MILHTKSRITLNVRFSADSVRFSADSGHRLVLI
jgi:hypothetical protein